MMVQHTHTLLLFLSLSSCKGVNGFSGAKDVQKSVRNGSLWASRLYQTTTSSVGSNSAVPSPPTDQSRVDICCQDPLVYTLPNILSSKECNDVQAHVARIQNEGARVMTLSNPPEISLSAAKLWPVPFLSLLAGVPPVIRLMQARSNEPNIPLDQILSAALPNVAIAVLASAVLAYGVVLPLLRKTSASSSRTSVALALNQPEDYDAIQPLVDRIVQVTGHSWDKWEAPVVTRYDPGAIFARHGDASPTLGSEWKDLGGQRVVTCICYLNTLQEGEGGETYFDQLSFGVAPEQGKALVFFPASADTWVADDRTTHESLPPTQEKWILQMFGRAQRVPPPLGLPDSYGKHQSAKL
eukprot:CAMPEP_0172455142 /NCGR_PEP_ID=MMETSP1065-20121228/11914_1 /TAXON_ID=265537 /ORGANISM="Amphiprora paludosa, Strain CCMP125" /LENGTH=353 /DNA_ID=CAMNT_0013207599 /DNA_START=31 /DNA_END=1092 /DNA_ORIENTATION=+